LLYSIVLENKQQSETVNHR